MKTKKYTRKIILLSAVAVFAVIYGIQLVLANKSPAKTFSLKEKPTELVIQSGENTIHLVLEGGLWYTGENKESCDDSKVQELVDAVCEIQTLGTVSTIKSEQEAERYGFLDASSILVTASKDGNVLRTVKIGKEGASSQTSYIQLDGSPHTLLAKSNFADIFSVEEDDLKLKAEETEIETENSSDTENL